jgi:hypothetical protein
MRRRAPDPEPEVRAGNCAPCGRFETLYKVPGIFRYRCAECYERERGHRPHLAPPRLPPTP